jgi:hypothetical protein
VSEAPSGTPPLVSDEEVDQWLALGPLEKKQVRLCLIAIGCLTTAALIGTAFSPYLATNYPRLRIVQTAGLLFQRGSIRDAQSKWRVGAGPVTAAEIAKFSPGCALPLPASDR